MSYSLHDLFFTFLRGFTGRHFFDNHNYRIRHSIYLIGCSFSPLTCSLEPQFVCVFVLFPQRVLLKEHFFENHNDQTSQNIRQRRKQAPDQAEYGSYDCPKNFLSMKPPKEILKNNK